jgi:hypothetical protein
MEEERKFDSLLLNKLVLFCSVLNKIYLILDFKIMHATSSLHDHTCIIQITFYQISGLQYYFNHNEFVNKKRMSMFVVKYTVIKIKDQKKTINYLLLITV